MDSERPSSWNQASPSPGTPKAGWQARSVSATDPLWSTVPTPPPLPTFAPSAHQVGVRERSEVEEICTNIQQWWADHEPEPWDKGIYATCQWALGKAAAPISGRSGPIDAEALREEDDTANDLIYSRNRGVPQAFAVGVQHTAMWLRGQTDDLPWLMIE